MLRWLVATVTVGVGLAACGTEEPAGEYTGPLMRPGQDCLSCHSADSGRGAPTWSAGGTVYAKADAKADEGVPGVQVILSQPDGTLIEKLVTNSVGNFYTTTELPRGFKVALEYQGQHIDMPCPPPAGLCNFCHSDPPRGNAPGRIYIPQGADAERPAFDCAGFDRGSDGMSSMSSAGTGPAAAGNSGGSAPIAAGGAASTPAAGSGMGGTAPAASCSGEASYQVTVEVTWADPAVDSRHFTTLIGGVHSSALSLWNARGYGYAGREGHGRIGQRGDLVGRSTGGDRAGQRAFGRTVRRRRRAGQEPDTAQRHVRISARVVR
jgi:hypothetical protein